MSANVDQKDTQASAPASWLDALAARWERRIAFLQNGCKCGPQSYHQGLIDAHGDCLKDLRADMESASNNVR